MKKEVKHDCPEKMVFSNKAGKCINPNLDQNENLNEDRNDKSKVPTKSLRFPKTLGNKRFPLDDKRKE